MITLEFGKALVDDGYTPIAYAGTIYEDERENFHPCYLSKDAWHSFKISRELYNELRKYAWEKTVKKFKNASN